MKRYQQSCHGDFVTIGLSLFSTATDILPDLNYHPLVSLADSAHCECGSEEQTPEHILQTCPHLEAVRQQFWPEDAEVGTKLWGQAAELQRTADFLAATGLRIFSTAITSNAEEEEEPPRWPGDKVSAQRKADLGSLLASPVGIFPG